MNFIIRLLVLCLVIVAIVFAVSNDVPASFTLWPFEYNITMPLYIPTLMALLIGMVFGGIVVAIKLLKIRLQLIRANRTIKKLQKSIVDNQQPVLETAVVSETTDTSQPTPQLQTTAQQQQAIAKLPY